MTGRLRRVLVNRPGERFGAAHETEGAFYAEAVDLPLAQAQHDALVAVLEDVGRASSSGSTREAGPDSIYTYDPALVCDGGAILLRSGKPIRQPEAPAMGEWFERNGIPVLARLEAPALADGGDLLWLDSRTLVIGRGFRTNDAGARAIKARSSPTSMRCTSSTCRSTWWSATTRRPPRRPWCELRRDFSACSGTGVR